MQSTDEERFRAFRIGAWTIYPDRNELRREEHAVRVQPRLIAVLRHLALNAGRTVTREALLDAAWSRRMVNDEVLSRTIADLRLALGDDARQPVYLETIPKLGYRLIAPVEWLAEPQVEASSVPTESPMAPKASVDPAPLAAPALDPISAPGRSWVNPVAALLLLATVAGALGWYWTTNPLPAEKWATRLLHAQPLTSDPGWELTPRLAHHSDLMAYSVGDAQSATTRLMLRSRDGQVHRALTDGTAYDICPLFSPDDSEVLWTRHQNEQCQILRAPLLGGAPSVLSDCAPDVLSCPDWVGEWLVYTAAPASAEHGAGLSRLRVRDGHREVVTSPPRGDGFDGHPRISNNGTIAYARGVSGDASLWLWNAKQGESHVEFPASMVYGQVWMPDGRLLVASDGLGFRALLAVDTANGKGELLGARGARYPDLHADGTLVYELASYDANLWQFPAEGEARRLTPSLRYDAYPRLAPDGRKVLYQSNRNGPESLYLLDLRSLEEIRLPLDPNMRWAQPAWSADGRALTLTRYAPSGIDLWQFVLGSDAPTPLPGAPANAHDAQWDPDGAHAWCRVGSERVAQLQRFALHGSSPPFTRPETVEHYQIDRQGLFLLLTGESQLRWCKDPSSADCVVLPVNIASAQRRNWAISDDAVYFVADDVIDAQKLTRYSLTSGALSVSNWPRPSTLNRGLDVARDQQFAIIASTDRVDIDLMWLRGE